jgi:hypothetical protein
MVEPFFVLLGLCLIVFVTTCALEHFGSRGGARPYIGYFALGAAPILALYHLLFRHEPSEDVLGLLAILAAAASGSFTVRHVDRRRRGRPRRA